ncbi:hypothetical protein Y919_05305 [Caloranaerobacter azorensis H53214]|uniref:TIGR02680 family protein n=2 Tax=Caloranaerobacter azorensis TaxID=116090 RepID=A0A096DMV3_9FIRM|nr:TIGR02680 family protein [Caloranaerobacter azorensis]KGG80586.1 hypothetical protein Y919_05305 [Caloranaerobacter azorensis H53214]
MIKLDMNRWIMNRAGLINFWYYDDEEFNFSDGKLLLRGANGSGKSVTMQSFIPLLLDGNKSPDRLDPFGSRARKLENYVLGDEDSGKDENISYIYMEFKKEKTENYLTIGMGLKAKKGKGLDFWGFAITDGRRIGKDFFLYKKIDQKVPLSRKELENRIGDGGEVKTKQKDYMAMVNKYLFGFDELEEYDELIKLLVQLRTPKLSKEFRPTVIYEILNNSLQPLSDEDLRPMSEAIENMDNIKNKLEQLEVSNREAKKLKKVYEAYNNFVLFEKARDYVDSYDKLKSLIKEKSKLEDKKSHYEEEISSAVENIKELEIQQDNLRLKEQELRKHDSFGLKEKINFLERELIDFKKERAKKADELERKKDRERELYAKIKKLEEDEEYSISKIREDIEELDSLADEMKFDEQFYMKQELLKDIRCEYKFNYVKDQVKAYRDKVIKIKRELEMEKVKRDAYEKALEDFERTKGNKNVIEKRLESANLLFSEIKEEFIERIYSWEKNNSIFKIDNNALSNISQAVNTYGDKTSFDDILALVRKEYNTVEDLLKEEKQDLSLIKSKYVKEYEEKLKEIKEWEEKRDPEPIREEKVLLNRERLRKNKIPFIPFYMAVDFKEELMEEEKGRLEETLLEMGILDALIIPSRYRDKVLEMDEDMADKYIFPSPKYLTYELSSKLRIEKIDVDGITTEDVDNAVKSILMDYSDEGTYIRDNGEYGIGIIKGKVTNRYRAKYIGSTARKRFRKETLERLTVEKQEIEYKIKEVNEKIETINHKLKKLEDEFNDFPNKRDLETALQTVREETLNYDNILRELDNKQEILDNTYRELNMIKQNIHNLTLNINLPVNLEAYENAEECIREYMDLLNELERKHSNLLKVLMIRSNIVESKEEIEIDIDNLRYDINNIDRKIKESEGRLKNYKKQLELTNYKEIEREINECIELLRKIPNMINELTEKRAKAETKLEQTIQKLDELNKDIELQKKINGVLETGFREEYLLGLVFSDDIEGDIYKLAKSVYNELKYFEDKNKNREDYLNNLHNKFYEIRQYLTEYSPKIEIIFDKEVDDLDISEIVLRQKRYVVKARVRGKYIGFYQLLDYIQEGIDENKRLIRESDRKIFEDILTKDIAKKIRGKIYHSRAWVDKMNKLMEGMNTSSGLSFSLKWKSKVAETEEQLDTNRLVELLMKDGDLLTDSEINELAAHFRSKIEEARRAALETGTRQTFHQIMKEVLDYRKWFEFRLYFKKTNERNKELTNNAFYKFSGGEKAMAMYVPLFSAVYAKYEGARKDCPKIISLDEAFAGVDENNIRDMFKLLNELELNFIINSQILWGDYDTVRSLSICELLRPNNAKEIAVLRYIWNGKVKTLVEDVGV